MTWPVYVPLVLPLLLVPLTGRLTRTAHPQAAARVLTACAVATAASSMGSLLLVVLTLLDDLPAMQRRERTASLAGIVLPEPVPDVVAAVAAVALAWAVCRAGAGVRCRRAVMRDLRAAGTPHNGLLVADWERPYAIAVPPCPRGAGHRSGYVLVTSGLLRLLDPDERAAVLAHERAHLRCRHHRLTAAAAVAAATHPLLRPVADGISLLVERAADEDAVETVGDRQRVARAVAKVALGSRPYSPGVLGIGASSVVRRVGALTGPPTHVSRVWSCLAALVVLGTLTATVAAVHDFVELVRAWWPPA